MPVEQPTGLAFSDCINVNVALMSSTESAVPV
jgi:hypothetical protein